MALFFLFLSSVLLATSLDEIKEVSKTDVQKAISMFLNYVKENPSDPGIETVGEFLFAKNDSLKLILHCQKRSSPKTFRNW